MARRAAARRLQTSVSRPESVRVPIEVGPAPESFLADAMATSTGSLVAHDATSRQFDTQLAYRQLISSGISSPEAAGLISYVVGLAPCESGWSLDEVNLLLFLRDLYRHTGWGKCESTPVRDRD
jgi:hypothetical protein